MSSLCASLINANIASKINKECAMQDKTTTVEELKQIFNKFVVDRDWAQFHTPKNIAMNLGIEVGELQELLVWHEGDALKDRVKEKKLEIENEVADIAFNLLQFCSMCNIDLSKAISVKLPQTAKKYPVDVCKGKNDICVQEGTEKKI